MLGDERETLRGAIAAFSRDEERRRRDEPFPIADGERAGRMEALGLWEMADAEGSDPEGLPRALAVYAVRCLASSDPRLAAWLARRHALGRTIPLLASRARFEPALTDRLVAEGEDEARSREGRRRAARGGLASGADVCSALFPRADRGPFVFRSRGKGFVLCAPTGHGVVEELALASARPLTELALALSAVAAGVAEAATRAAAEHARSRVQFGRPIARFAAVSERIARAHRDTLAAAELVDHLARRMDEGEPDRARAGAPFVLGFVARLALDASSNALQVHGGMGYTRDAGIELLYRSALSLGRSGRAIAALEA